MDGKKSAENEKYKKKTQQKCPTIKIIRILTNKKCQRVSNYIFSNNKNSITKCSSSNKTFNTKRLRNMKNKRWKI